MWSTHVLIWLLNSKFTWSRRIFTWCYFFELSGRHLYAQPVRWGRCQFRVLFKQRQRERPLHDSRFHRAAWKGRNTQQKLCHYNQRESQSQVPWKSRTYSFGTESKFLAGYASFNKQNDTSQNIWFWKFGTQQGNWNAGNRLQNMNSQIKSVWNETWQQRIMFPFLPVNCAGNRTITV